MVFDMVVYILCITPQSCLYTLKEPYQKFRHNISLRPQCYQCFQRPLLYRSILVLSMVEDKVALVVHGKLRMPLESEDVVADAKTLVAAEVAGGYGDGSFRQTRHLVVVVDDETHFAVGEVREQVCIQNPHLADAHAPAAREAFHASAQCLCDELVPETNADKGHFPRRRFPNPIL